MSGKKVRRHNDAPSKPARAWNGMWQTIGAVLIASMNKGLFVPACLFFLVLVMLLKTPSEYFPTLWNALADYHQWGYIVALVAVCGWGMNVRYLRRIHHNEVARISGEKKQLQEERAGRIMPSSDEET
jgi:hypothetical protein